MVPNTHAQNVYENCAAIINADVLSDFVVDVELGLLDDMQEEVRKMRKQMGEEQIKDGSDSKVAVNESISLAMNGMFVESIAGQLG